MTKDPRLLEKHSLAGIAVLAVLVVSAVSLSGQVTAPSSAVHLAGSRYPHGVPEEYVITPFGYYHPSCVHQVGEGETILPDGRIQHANGSVDDSAPICIYPHYSPNGSVISQSQPMVENCTPASGGSWIESIGATTRMSYGKLSATWTVPPPPSTNDGQLLYFFPGLVQCVPNPPSILQPVLQWGRYNGPHGDAFGGSYWLIVSWNAYGNTGVYHGLPSPEGSVNPGDEVSGIITSSCRPGGNSCPTWNVVTEDKNTGGKSTLAKTPSEGQVWNWAFGGVLEAYGVQQCTDYPANGNVAFKVHLYDQSLNAISNPGWKGNPADPGRTPQCGYGLGITATKETLDYAITYSYVGGPYQFTNFSSPVVCPITGFFTTAQPLPPNWSGNVIPTSLMFTDCVSKVTSINGVNSGIGVGTNGQGRIVYWTVYLPGPPVNVLVKKDDGTSFTATSWLVEAQNSGDHGSHNTDDYCSADLKYCAWADGEGTWTGP